MLNPLLTGQPFSAVRSPAFRDPVDSCPGIPWPLVSDLLEQSLGFLQSNLLFADGTYGAAMD